MDSQAKYAIVLANAGTPESLSTKNVRSFIRRYLSDKRIRPINPILWFFILNICILPKRVAVSAGKYEKIWTDMGSPLAVATEKLQQALQESFSEDGFSCDVHIGYSYSFPYLHKILKRIKKDGSEKVVVLPMYPQTAHCTTYSIIDAVHKIFKSSSDRKKIKFINNYYKNEVYAKAVAASIINAGFKLDSNDKLLFSFHSIPIKDIEAGDKYELQASSSCLLIADELGLEKRRWKLSFHSRFDKEREWLSPFTKDTLLTWAATGEGRTFVACPGFAVDNLETLYDVGIDYRSAFENECAKNKRDSKDSEFIYVPCLGSSKAHLKVLKSVLASAIKDVESNGR